MSNTYEPYLFAGERFAGRYEILEEVGAGGMGTVYRAVDLPGQCAVAVKIVRVGDRTAEHRFEREAAALGGISHPAVVRYLAHGRDRGLHYLVMDWLEGITLDEHLAEVGVTPGEAIALIARAAGGLAAVHAHGLVHRDIKPSNLMLVDGVPERVAILDFGVARPAAHHGIVTCTGRTVGTPGYMSPEQARGDRALDARSDVFSLGCVLYQCLTSRAPFPGEHPTAVCAKVLFHDPLELGALWPEAPPALRTLVERCLAKDPAARPRDGAELARQLAALPPIDPALPRRVRYEPPITRPVEPLVSVLLAMPSTSSPRGAFELARRLGGRADMLADGTLLVELTGGTTLYHADCIAKLVAVLEPGVLAVATGDTGRGEVAERAARAFEDEAIAAALLAQPPRGAVRADTETIGRLAPPLDALYARASYILTRSSSPRA